MEYSILKDLQPFEFFKWFGEICKIPHGSKNEIALIEYIVYFAKERNLDCDIDEKGNLFVKLPATKGYEGQPSILLQAHLDMVCAKDDGIDFDFENDSLNLKIIDDCLCADGTSLGADNGVGVATMLAIADSKEIKHPPLELLFTVEEEIGLHGIRAFDTNKITARRMINMDCGDSHVIAVSSMGKKSCKTNRKFDLIDTKEDECSLEIAIDGGLGGHPALSIRKGRACACNILGELILSVLDLSVKLDYVYTLGLPATKNVCANIVLPKENKDKAIEVLNTRFNEIKTIYEKTDANVSLSFYNTDFPQKTITKEATEQIANLLCLIKTAPYREDGNDNSILLTLGFLGKASLVEGEFLVDFMIRSSLDYDLSSYFAFYKRTAKLLGFDIEEYDSYSGWRETKNSPFRDKAVVVHKKLFEYEPTFERVQGGIETAIITEKIKDMDAIGFAPTARGAHTTKERIFIKETLDFWNWMISLLETKE